MKTKITNTYFLLLGLVLVVAISCKKKEEVQPDNFIATPAVDINNKETIHTDTTYQYEYRSGESGNYEYNYDVSGTDDNGDEVSGNVSMNGRYGSGTITNSNGEEIEVETEWINKGVLNATDVDGKEYQLTVN
jgi:hypothetical protein